MQPGAGDGGLAAAEHFATIWEPVARPGVGVFVVTKLLRRAPLKGNIAMQKRSGSLVALLVFLSAAAPGIARAEDKKAADKSAPKVKVYDFSGDTIEGDLIRPDGSVVDARDFAKHASLIRIRNNFIPEIIKSAEDL